MINSEKLFGTPEYLAVYTGCRKNRCRYNRVPLFIQVSHVQYSYTESTVSPFFIKHFYL